jgi:xanthine dehydrogenase accessory factor
MKKVIEEVIKQIKKNEPCVLASVVRTKGSTPQKAGAKLLVRKDGSFVGTLGGGCVEGDIWYAAKEIFENHSGPQFRDYYLDEELAARDGLVCGGTMYFFIEPIWSTEDYLPFVREINKAYEGGPAIAMATVVHDPAGHNILGAKLLIREDGSTSGSLGDSELEQIAIKVGRKLAAYGENEHIQAEDGTEIYVEGFTSPPTLVLMGGGHVGKAVSFLAATLGFRIYVVDDRPEFANKERFPEAAETIVADFTEALEKIPTNSNTYILVATRGHRYDDMAVKAAVRTSARYIGLLGSKRKSILICKDLLQQGISLERLKEIRAPVGLNIGAITPEELAVSIMAEIIMCRRGGDGMPLKMDEKYMSNIKNK